MVKAIVNQKQSKENDMKVVNAKTYCIGGAFALRGASAVLFAAVAFAAAKFRGQGENDL